MKNYLTHSFSTDDFELVSVIDELPLWSAPFGLRLLDTIKLKPRINALDIGCGLGFPLIEVAQRLGTSSKVFGIDPFPYGIKANAKAMDMAQTFSFQQKLTERKQPLDEIFPKEAFYREEAE